ncbi:ABC transporter permease [Microbacterium mangrovi]|uniref:ABC transporter permease n=1 Tax=Microbacterium mangrovi TaxID=1348253 RepID=A0A0B2A4M2_9MICO|nr:ABC transporter permease [Microbacterium mangrovi]KHK98434.1 ABC transporter permease [Microbacterium mangrovi]
MVAFLTRRFLASLLVLLIASYIVYILTCYSGNPLQDLMESNAKNKDQLIAQRVAYLHLDIPPFLRYFLWLGGILAAFTGNFTLGLSNSGQPVTAQLGAAAASTLHLVLTATIVAIIFGVIIGITTALRQYTAYDYGATLLSFLFFSLPIFWLAVMLKQYVAIGFNNFLADPVIATSTIIVLSLVSGVIWLGIIGGNWKRRLIVFGVAAVATGAVLTFLSVTKWFDDPSLGIVVITVMGVGFAFLVTTLSAGLENRKALYSALTVVVIGAALYYPLQYVFAYMNLWIMLVLALVAIAVGIVVGLLFGGADKWVSARTAAITASLMGLTIMLDRYMQVWNIYSNASSINGRPIATIGASTPGLSGDFWVSGVDQFAHILLPTLALMLASLAGYSRYSRASMLDVMNQDYIRTARSKGLTERTVVMRHAFRNALIPIVTIITLDFGALIGGAIVTENVFSIQGMGNLFNEAITHTDVNTIMGVFLVTGIAAILFNAIADVVYSALDPRIRVSS